MPTLPEHLHQHQNVAEGFGADAERYDRARPRYPEAMVAAIVSASPGPAFLDIGMGTGIAARQFAAARCPVLGVEVGERMARQAERWGLNVEVAKFEEWDPAGRIFDAVIAAQAWHWIDAEAGTAKAAEALRPGGVLAVFWNAEHAPQEFADAFAEVYRRELPDSLGARRWAAGGDTRDGYAAMCLRAATAMRESGRFAEAEQWQFSWERRYRSEEYVEQLLTTGDHAQFAPKALEQLSSAISAAIEDLGGSLLMGYSAMVSIATRRSDA